MSELQKMFNYQGKTTKVIGTTRTKAYQEIYNYISELQESKTIKTHENYLNDNGKIFFPVLSLSNEKKNH